MNKILYITELEAKTLVENIPDRLVLSTWYVFYIS